MIAQKTRESGYHFWAREIARFGHTVRLMAPQYVKGDGNQSCVKFIQEPSAVPKWQFNPSKLLKTVT